MARALHNGMLVAACTIFIASTSNAGIPPTLGDISEGGLCINVGPMLGSGAAATHPIIVKNIFVFDGTGTPIPGSVVVIDFLDCIDGVGSAIADIELADAQPFPGLILSCPDKMVTAISNAVGVASFSVVGYATNAGLTALSPAVSDVGHDYKCASVYADGFFLGTLNVGAFDEEGTGGTNPLDFALLLADRIAFLPGPSGTNAYRGRSDYDGNMRIDPVDLATWLAIRVYFVSTGSNGISGTACLP